MEKFHSHSDDVFIKLINVKMTTIVGILTFISRINLMASKSSITTQMLCSSS